MAETVGTTRTETNDTNNKEDQTGNAQGHRRKQTTQTTDRKTNDTNNRQDQTGNTQTRMTNNVCVLSIYFQTNFAKLRYHTCSATMLNAS